MSNCETCGKELVKADDKLLVAIFGRCSDCRVADHKCFAYAGEFHCAICGAALTTEGGDLK